MKRFSSSLPLRLAHGRYLPSKESWFRMCSSYSLWYCRSASSLLCPICSPISQGPTGEGKPVSPPSHPSPMGCSQLGCCLRDAFSVLPHTAVVSCCVYLSKHLGQGRRLCRDPGQQELKTSWSSLPAGPGSLSSGTQGLPQGLRLLLLHWKEAACGHGLGHRQPHSPTRETGWLCPRPSVKPGLSREHKSPFPSPNTPPTSIQKDDLK